MKLIGSDFGTDLGGSSSELGEKPDDRSGEGFRANIACTRVSRS